LEELLIGITLRSSAHIGTLALLAELALLLSPPLEEFVPLEELVY
jgi:hypothetical protein